MKSSLLTLALLIICGSAQAVSAPFPLDGTYAFKGQYEVSTSIDNRIVYAFTDLGKLELKELKADGYMCELKQRETHLCKKHLGATELPEEVKLRVMSLAQNLKITFLNHAPEAPDTLESDSEDVKEWRIMQKVQIGDRYWGSYRYQLLQNQHHKVILGEGGESATIYFMVKNSDEMGSYIGLHEKNPKGFRQYGIMAKLTH